MVLGALRVVSSVARRRARANQKRRQIIDAFSFF
jgi:hypothetical protein